MTPPNLHLAALTDAGVSVWLDFMRRSRLTAGTLERDRKSTAATSHV